MNKKRQVKRPKSKDKGREDLRWPDPRPLPF